MTDPWLVADPLLPPFVSAGILIASTVFFIWMERKREIPYFSLRMVSVIVMMLALAGFLFRPRYQTARSEEIILLTPDYNRSQVDSLLKLNPTLKVFHSGGAEPYGNSIAVKSYHDLSNELENIAFILGQGLPPAGLDLFLSHNYQFIPSAHPAGVIGLAMRDDIIQNRPAIVEGIFNSPSENSKLVLSGPGGKEDSITFSRNGLQSFRLSFLPKKAGRFLYALESKDTLVGRLPVNVQEEEQLNILFILHYPTFETRYLKEYLGKKHSLLLRYQLSRSKFRYEVINRKAKNINRLTKESLSEFDLLIIDTDALRSLGASEKNNLRSAIEEGLGLLPFFNAAPGSTNDMFRFEFKRYAADTAHIFLNGSKHILPAWPFSAISEADTHIIFKNGNRILSGYHYQGFGKTGFQLLQETYRLILQGDSIAYGALWSAVLEKISGSHIKESTAWPQKANFPLYPDSPVRIEIISSANEPDVVVNDINIPIEESILVDDLWMGKFWTDLEGWNRVAVAGNTVQDLYISNPDEWRSLAIANALENTRRAASSARQEKKLTDVFLPVPGWIFYLLFLLGGGFLWLAPKL